jgi:hypothetical protein
LNMDHLKQFAFYIVLLTALCLVGFFAAHRADSATVCPIFLGCTNTSTSPGYGKILIGGKNGEYEFVASSTLSSNAGAAASSTLLRDNNTFSGTNAFATTTASSLNRVIYVTGFPFPQNATGIAAAATVCSVLKIVGLCGTVHMSAGTYDFPSPSGPISLPGGIVYEGDGDSTYLLQSGTTNLEMLKNQHTSTGGDAAIVLRNFKIQRNQPSGFPATGTHVNAVSFNGVSSSTVDNVTFVYGGIGWAPLTTYESTPNTMTLGHNTANLIVNSRFIQAITCNQFVQSSHSKGAHNYCEAIGDSAMQVLGAWDDVTYEDNTVIQTGATGAGQSFEATGDPVGTVGGPWTGLKWINNNARASIRNGFYVEGRGADNSVITDTLIQGNTAASSSQYGFFMGGDVQGVKFLDNTSHDNGFSGLALVTDASSTHDVTISNNHLYDNSKYTSRPYALYLWMVTQNASSSNITVTNNDIYDWHSSSDQECIRETLENTTDVAYSTTIRDNSCTNIATNINANGLGTHIFATTTVPAAVNAFSIAGSGASAPAISIDGLNTRVGIGTTTPTQELSVVGDAYLTGDLTLSHLITGNALNSTLDIDGTNGSYIRILRNGHACASFNAGEGSGIASYLCSGATFPFSVYTSSDSSALGMRMLSSGKLGIGTSSPPELLTVAGNIYTDANIGIGQVDATNYPLNIAKTNVASINLHDLGTSGGDSFIDFTQDTPGSVLWRIWDQSNVMHLLRDNTHQVDRIEAASGATGGLFLQPNGGNVGIGTTSPGSAVSIQGNQFIAGNITSTSTISSIFPYASTTAITSSVASTSLLFVNGLGGCSAGQYLTWSAGSFGCATDQNTGGTATTSFASTYPLTLTPSASALTYGFNGLATTSPWTIGQLAYVADGNHITSIGTTSVSCSGNISCNSFNALGSASTISFTGTLSVGNGGTGASSIGAGQVLATDLSGNVISTSTPTAAFFTATSTTATTSLQAVQEGQVGHSYNSYGTLNLSNQKSGQDALVIESNTSAGIGSGVLLHVLQRNASDSGNAVTFKGGTGASQNVLFVTNGVGDALQLGESVMQITNANASDNAGGTLLKLTPAGSSIHQLNTLITTDGLVGFGTTSPYAPLSVQYLYGATTSAVFAVASSTNTSGSSATQLFTVSSVGSTTIGLFGACSGSSALQTSATGLIQCGTLSLSNSLSHDGTLSGTSFNGSAAVSDWGLNLGNANTWTALQQFNGNASSTESSCYGPCYFGGTATSSFGTNGALTLTTPLAIASGGTGTTSGGTSNGIMFYDSGNTRLTNSSAMTWSGTNLVVKVPQNGVAQLNDANGTNAIWSTNIGIVTQGSGQEWLVTQANTDLNFGTGATRNSITTGSAGMVFKAVTQSLGVGTTTPDGRLAVQYNYGNTFSNVFVVGSSTNSSNSTYTTLLSVDKVGTTTLGLFGACSGANALQTSAAGLIQCGAVSSDVRLKENIEPIVSALDLIMQTHPVTFNYKPEANMGSQQEAGFIAQDLGEVIPDAVETVQSKTSLTPGGERDVKPNVLLAYAVEAIKEQQAQIKKLTPGKAMRSVEENWQDALIAMLIVYVGYNEYDKRRRR